MSRQASDFNLTAATKFTSNGNGTKQSPMDIERIFGENAFGLDEMKTRLAPETFSSLLATIDQGRSHRSGNWKRGGECHERMGDGARRYSFHALGFSL